MSETAGTILDELDPSRLRHERNNGANGSDRPTMSALVVAEFLWHKRRLISRCTISAFALSAVVAFVLPKQYTATTRLMPPSYGAGSTMALALPSLSDQGGGSGDSIVSMASRLLGIDTSGDLLIGVIKSQSVEDRVIKSFNLMDLYSDKYIEDCRKDLESHTLVATDVKTGIISISVTDRSPTRASHIANAYVTELNATLAQVNTSAAHRERLFLEARLEEVRQTSEADAKEFALFSSQNGAIDIPEQAKSMVTAGAELQSQLIVAQSELKGLEQIYASNNARVRAARARVDELQSQVNKFGGKNVNPATDSSLGQDQLYPSVRQLPLLGVKYLDLYRRSKVDEVVFELLTKEYEIAKIQEAREIPTAQVLDPALVPAKKSSPHRLIIAFCGMLAALLSSSGYLVGCLAWECIDDNDRRKQFLADVLSSVGHQIHRVPLLRTTGSHLIQKLGLHNNNDGVGK